MCRSPRMSPSSISSGSSPSRAAASSSPRFSRSSGGMNSHAEPLVDLLLGRERLGLARLVVRDAVLAHVEAALHRLGAERLVVPAGAGEVLEQVPEGLLRARSGGRPRGRSASPPSRRPRRSSRPSPPSGARRTPRRTRRDRSRRRRCRGPSRCRRAGARFPASSTRIAAGWSRSAATSSSATGSAFDRIMRALGGRRRRPRSAASRFSSAFLPKPFTSFSWPSSAALRSSSIE